MSQKVTCVLISCEFREFKDITYRRQRRVVFATGCIYDRNHLRLSIAAKPIHTTSPLRLPHIFVAFCACVALILLYCVIIILALHKVCAKTHNEMQFARNYFVSEVVRSARRVHRFAYVAGRLQTLHYFELNSHLP